MAIRVATAADCPSVFALQHAILPDYHFTEYAMNIWHPRCLNLVEVGTLGAIVGFISVLVDSVDPSGPELWQHLRPYLAFVGVLPAAQRRHVGTNLVRAALYKIVPRIASGMWLECRDSAQGGASVFYEKLGFSRVASERVEQMTGVTPRGLVYCIGACAATI